MATPCSCHVIDTALVQAYLREHGAILTEKNAKAARSALHKHRKDERRADGLADKSLCGVCALSLLNHILAESRKMYPQQHAKHEQAERLPEAA